MHGRGRSVLHQQEGEEDELEESDDENEKVVALLENLSGFTAHLKYHVELMLLANAFKLSVQEQMELAASFARCAVQCYEPGFCGPLRSMCGADGSELVTSPHLRAAVRSAFEKAPSHNIQSEDRFARANTHHGATTHGKAPAHETIAAAHVNAEAQAWHGVAMNKHMSQHARIRARTARTHQF